MSHPELNMSNGHTSLSESDFFSLSTSSVSEMTLEDSFRSLNHRKPVLSTSLSLPVASITKKDSSSQTDEQEVKTSRMSQRTTSFEERTPAKEKFLTKPVINRYASHEGLERASAQSIDERALSAGAAILKMNNTVVAKSPVRTHKRSKSLKLSRNKKYV